MKSNKPFFQSITFSTTIVLIIWSVHIITRLTEISLTSWGIFPREADGLLGIITAPLVHGSWEHLFSNSAPLFVSTTIIYYFYKRVAWASFFFIYLATGLSVWLLGRSVYHIGASGVVYGLISFIFWSGIFRRNIKSIVLALVVTILYSGYLGGIVPNKEGVSWESHLLGAIVGIIVAFLFKSVIESDEEEIDPWADEIYADATPYFPRDVFDMTNKEREEMRRQEALLKRQLWEERQRLRDLGDDVVN